MKSNNKYNNGLIAKVVGTFADTEERREGRREKKYWLGEKEEERENIGSYPSNILDMGDIKM